MDIPTKAAWACDVVQCSLFVVTPTRRNVFAAVTFFPLIFVLFLFSCRVLLWRCCLWSRENPALATGLFDALRLRVVGNVHPLLVGTMVDDKFGSQYLKFGVLPYALDKTGCTYY